jgi:hypothetical protein
MGAWRACGQLLEHLADARRLHRGCEGEFSSRFTLREQVWSLCKGATVFCTVLA